MASYHELMPLSKFGMNAVTRFTKPTLPRAALLLQKKILDRQWNIVLVAAICNLDVTYQASLGVEGTS
jgi:hypothetical protein